MAPGKSTCGTNTERIPGQPPPSGDCVAMFRPVELTSRGPSTAESPTAPLVAVLAAHLKPPPPQPQPGCPSGAPHNPPRSHPTPATQTPSPLFLCSIASSPHCRTYCRASPNPYQEAPNASKTTDACRQIRQSRQIRLKLSNQHSRKRWNVRLRTQTSCPVPPEHLLECTSASSRTPRRESSPCGCC